jgi:hypothetical protein
MNPRQDEKPEPLRTFKRVEDMPPLNREEFTQYLRRDLDYLQGIADALDLQPLKNKIHGMSRNLKRFTA